jgi:predicted ATPase
MASRERVVAPRQTTAGGRRGPMLKKLRLRDVGPASSFDIEFSDRLNIFTGDNGLGKSFILEIAWWALTGTWAGPRAWPQIGGDVTPRIGFQFKTKSGAKKAQSVSSFNFAAEKWPRKQGEFITSALVIYARVDGTFSVWDPARIFLWESKNVASQTQPRAFQFSHETLWGGLPENGHTLCNGLIRDWVSWQMQHTVEVIKTGNRPKTSPFETLERVMKSLATIPGESATIGTPVRLSALDVTDIPTLTMPYGELAIVHASAGMKRIISLAYLLTWAWDEHKKASSLHKQEPAEQIVLLVDEVESHLHPRWQRTLLPSILGIADDLNADVDVQILATTHSPLVLASIEPHFDQARDSLFLFELEENSRHVTLRKLPWAMHGDVVGWLTSPVFGLDQARSPEAEKAIEAAEAFMRGDSKRLPAGLKTKASIHKALQKTLPGLDPFWPRWIVGAKP